MKRIWVTHGDVTEEEIKRAVQFEIDGIQLRCKDLLHDQLFTLAKSARQITREAGIKLIVNTAIEIAEEIKADGVHLPECTMNRESSLPVSASVHSLEMALRAEALGVKSLVFGPIFSTPSKLAYGAPQGLNKLKELIESVSIPVYAIGGIIPERFQDCFDCGVKGVMMQNYISSQVRK